jgi:hypothetical protein
MESAYSSERLQGAMRLGTAQDLYYYSKETMHKQSIPTVVDTRFKQALNNLRQGSSTFIISVDQGISDVLLAVKLPEAGGDISYNGLALPKGWVYDAINRISVRYSGSSQYFWLGSQVRMENLREMPNPTTRDELLELGGVAMTTASAFSGDNLYAYAYINLPHNSPNGSLEKPNPFPSEMLQAPIVVTCEMNSLPSIFSSILSTGVAGAPQAFSEAFFQIKQVHANDRGDLMVASADRNKAYSFPTKCFYQNQIDVPLIASADEQSIQLTGLRSGEVRSIIMWITKDVDTNPNVANGGVDASGHFVKNFTNFVLPRDVQLLYNGTVFYDAPATSSQFWNLVSTETPSKLESSVLSITNSLTNPAFVATAEPRSWIEIPFSQVYEQLSGSHMYVAGKQVVNAVLNVNLKLPEAVACTLHAVYAYNCVLMVNNGTVEYVF